MVQTQLSACFCMTWALQTVSPFLKWCRENEEEIGEGGGDEEKEKQVVYVDHKTLNIGCPQKFIHRINIHSNGLHLKGKTHQLNYQLLSVFTFLCGEGHPVFTISPFQTKIAYLQSRVAAPSKTVHDTAGCGCHLVLRIQGTPLIKADNLLPWQLCPPHKKREQSLARRTGVPALLTGSAAVFKASTAVQYL